MCLALRSTVRRCGHTSPRRLFPYALMTVYGSSGVRMGHHQNVHRVTAWCAKAVSRPTLMTLLDLLLRGQESRTKLHNHVPTFTVSSMTHVLASNLVLQVLHQLLHLDRANLAVQTSTDYRHLCITPLSFW